MTFDFSGKRILVTGGTRGIGRAAVEAVLEAGAIVAVNGRTAQSTEQALKRLSIEAVAASGDVSKAADCRTIVASAVKELGGLDVLVNCAGIASLGNVETVDEALWDAILDTNLKGTFFTTQAALPYLRSARGNIVNLASDAGLIGDAGLTVYCASKGGVVNLTRALALELAPDVRVNCVCPGYVDTDMLRQEIMDVPGTPSTIAADLAATAPLNRIAGPDEIATAILYLASDHARYMTGSALQIDGGTTAGHPRRT